MWIISEIVGIFWGIIGLMLMIIALPFLWIGQKLVDCVEYTSKKEFDASGWCWLGNH